MSRGLALQRRTARWLTAANVTLLGATLVAAIARFGTIGTQSFWVDEAMTADVLDGSFSKMLSAVVSSQAEAPLYFVVAWPWAQVFGESEVALRSLSALVGTACVPIVYAAARNLVGRRSALVAGALVATSPALIWYSQEARSYSLWTMLSVLAFLFWVRALAAPTTGNLLGWSVTSCLALATHYFALALIGPEALWLLLRVPRRRAGFAVGGVGLAVLALLPVVLYQRTHGGADWIGESPLAERLETAASFLATGVASAVGPTSLLVGLASAGALVLVTVLGSTEVRRWTALILVLVAIALGVPLLGHLVGQDYFLSRNVLPVWPLLAIAIAAAAGLRKAAGAVGLLIAVVLSAAFVNQDIRVATTAFRQRDDWRGVARTLRAAPERGRVIVVQPGFAHLALAFYLPGLRPMPRATRAAEIALVTDLSDPRGTAKLARRVRARGPFDLHMKVTVQRRVITLLRARTPIRVTRPSLSTPGRYGARPFTAG